MSASQAVKSTVLYSETAENGTVITVSLASGQPLTAFPKLAFDAVVKAAEHIRDVLDGTPHEEIEAR